jgi:hypothetical protein
MAKQFYIERAIEGAAFMLERFEKRRPATSGSGEVGGNRITGLTADAVAQKATLHSLFRDASRQAG